MLATLPLIASRFSRVCVLIIILAVNAETKQRVNYKILPFLLLAERREYVVERTGSQRAFHDTIVACASLLLGQRRNSYC